MGAFGIGPFESDSASLVLGFLEERGDQYLVEALMVVAKRASDPGMEHADCECAMAVAELIAAAAGHPSRDLPSYYSDWLQRNKLVVGRELAALTEYTVRAILRESELKEQWTEDGCLREWVARVEELLGRIGQIDLRG